MIKKFKNIIALTLMVVFIMPVTVKFLDGVFHKHVHFHNTTTDEVHFYDYHKECPIPSYKLSFFSVKKHILTIQKYFYSKEINNNYNFIYHCNNSKYSFLLRAPPIFTNKIFAS